MLIERVMAEETEAGISDKLSNILSDLNMLRLPGGCERTPNEFRALLAKGGFSMRRIVPTGRHSVIEGAAA